jgi:hypothetical protein
VLPALGRRLPEGEGSVRDGHPRKLNGKVMREKRTGTLSCQLTLSFTLEAMLPRSLRLEGVFELCEGCTQVTGRLDDQDKLRSSRSS